MHEIEVIEPIARMVLHTANRNGWLVSHKHSPSDDGFRRMMVKDACVSDVRSLISRAAGHWQRHRMTAVGRL